MGKYSTPDVSDISGTSIPIGTSDTPTFPTCGLNGSPNIGNIRKFATPDFRDSDKLDTSIDGKFANNLVAPPILIDLLSDKISNSSSWDLYACIGMHPAAYHINFVTPQFVHLGFYTVDSLDKVAGL